MPDVDVDVAIVGYGPVGATLANLLGLSGLSVAVFERESTVYHAPRAAHFDDEVMRVWQNIGLAKEIVSRVRVNAGMRFVSASGEVLVDWPRPQEVGPNGWHPSYRFHQPYLELALRAGLERFDRHRVYLNAEVTELAPDADGVTVLARDSVSGEPVRARARFAVGCDGGRSIVRAAMESPLEDLGSHQRWVIIDAALSEPIEALGDTTLQYCDPARPATYARCVENRRRWELMILPGEDEAELVSPAGVARLLSPWIQPGQATIERAIVYTFHAVMATGWRRGRLIVAGDAAHQMPPFLGQGMCAGIRDAANLSWKLAAVIDGCAPASLLDTYESERAPHVRAYVDLAVRLGNLVQITDERKAAERDRLLSAQPELLKSIKPRLGPGLSGTAPPPAGYLSAQPVLSDGVLMDDRVGLHFALLTNAERLGTLGAAVRHALRAADVVLLEDEGREYLREAGCAALLVRPDRYVLGTANTADELQALLDRVPIRRSMQHA